MLTLVTEIELPDRRLKLYKKLGEPLFVIKKQGQNGLYEEVVGEGDMLSISHIILGVYKEAFTEFVAEHSLEGVEECVGTQGG